MNNDTYTTTATLTGHNTLVLDDVLPVTGRVRVTIEQLPEAQIVPSFLVKLQAIHRALAQSGYQPRTPETINEQIRAERVGWGK